MAALKQNKDAVSNFSAALTLLPGTVAFTVAFIAPAQAGRDKMWQTERSQVGLKRSLRNMLFSLSKSATSLAACLLCSGLLAQPANAPLLTVKQVMNSLITPTTATIWGAYQLETEAQWQEVENAALAVIGAGNLLAMGGAGEGEAALAAEADWQRFNAQMITAARQVLAAVAARDEEALFNAGNDALYPPCESCHQQYQNQ